MLQQFKQNPRKKKICCNYKDLTLGCSNPWEAKEVGENHMTKEAKFIALQRIISGGQTGVDRAALEAALDHQIAMGGWCPKGLRAEDGSISAHYGLKETPSEDYVQRTEWNVRDSDGTLILTWGVATGGTLLTIKIAKERQKPHFIVDLKKNPSAHTVQEWLMRKQISILNIAGPRESKVPGIFQKSKKFLDALFDLIFPVEKPLAKQVNFD